MTLAIRWGEDNTENSGFIYMDAVTSYTRNYKGQVTKHPVDQGGNITDHFIKDNPTFTISAVITGVDISTGTYLIQDLEGNTPYNSGVAPSAVSVNSTDDSVLRRFIPDSLGQFLSDSTPDVVVDTQRIDLIEQIRDALISLNSGVKFNEDTGQFDSNIELVRLFEFDGYLLKRILNNLVITNITFREDANTGFALYCDITFEQITFASLRKTEIPQDVQQTLSKKAASKEDQGKQNSLEVDEDELPDQTDRDGLRTPYGDVVNEKQFGLGQTLDTGSL